MTVGRLAAPRCRATSAVPAVPLLAAVLAAQRAVAAADYVVEVPEAVQCELAAWHAGEHAAFTWSVDGPGDVVVWMRWPHEGPARFETLPACEAADDGGVVCALPADHPAGLHGWQVRDAPLERARRAVAR